MFCTAADFNLLPYAIPNLSQVVNTFQPYVDMREKEVLTKLLGSQLYEEWMTQRAALPPEWNVTTAYLMDSTVVHGISIWKALTDNTGAVPVEGADWTKVEDNRWLMLEKGTTFNEMSYQFQWLGIKDMLVPYIWSQWTKDTFDNNSGIGVVQGKAENAEVIAPVTRIRRAFNIFSEKADTMYGFIESANTAEAGVIIYNGWNYCYPGTMNDFGL